MVVERTGTWVGMTRCNVNVFEGRQLLGERWIIPRHTCTWQPPVDVYEDDDGVVIRVEVAGMRSEDFSISLTERMLVVAGTRVDPAPKRTYHQMEIRFGEFRAEVYLPWQVEPEDVGCQLRGGVSDGASSIPGVPARIRS